MPWSHCDVAFILDDEACPACGMEKDAWTVELDKTRNLVISLPRGWLELQLLDRAGRPLGGQPFDVLFASGLRRKGTLDEQGLVRLSTLVAGDLTVAFPGVELRHCLRRKAGQEERQPGERPIPISQALCRGTDGERHVFVLAPPRVKVDLPLQVHFRSQAEATTWLLLNPTTVEVDGEPVEHGAFVADDRLVVQLAVPEGEHQVAVWARGAGGRLPLLRQTVRVAQGPAPAAVAARPVRTRAARVPVDRVLPAATLLAPQRRVVAPPRSRTIAPAPPRPPVAGRHVLLAPPRVKVDLPLQARFRSQAEATTWLLLNPTAVEVDDEPVEHGAFVAEDRLVVQLVVPEGEHRVVAWARGAGGRLPLLRQTVRVAPGPAPAAGEMRLARPRAARVPR